MKKFLFTVVFLANIIGITCVLGQERMSKKEYIAKYSDIAVTKMKQFHIPASITLAQGILESGSGSSRLAVRGNNHFGIKCGKNWTGRKIYKTDDNIGDCFRRYDSAEESYSDHSKFLTENQRYAPLFALDITDYKGWAKGLKAAGYATNPQYPSLLIKLIEENELYKYDRVGATGSNRKVDGLVGWIIGNAKKRQPEPIVNGKTVRQTDKLNGVRYVIARDGDTFETISNATRISVEKLLQFNDLYTTLELHDGDALYIQKKKAKSRSNYMHEVKKDETIHSISQLYGVQLKSLYRLNPQYSTRQPLAGSFIRLR